MWMDGTILDEIYNEKLSLGNERWKKSVFSVNRNILREFTSWAHKKHYYYLLFIRFCFRWIVARRSNEYQTRESKTKKIYFLFFQSALMSYKHEVDIFVFFFAAFGLFWFSCATISACLTLLAIVVAFFAFMYSLVTCIHNSCIAPYLLHIKCH